jgi:hypothetical protein
MAPHVLIAVLAVIVVAGRRSEERDGRPPAAELDRQLVEAAGRGGAGDVRALLRRGASVEARDDRGRTALAAAANANEPDTPSRRPRPWEVDVSTDPRNRELIARLLGPVGPKATCEECSSCWMSTSTSRSPGETPTVTSPAWRRPGR